MIADHLTRPSLQGSLGWTVEFLPVDECGFCPCNLDCLLGIDASSRDCGSPNHVETVACCHGNRGHFPAFSDSSAVCVHADRRVGNNRPGPAPAALAEKASRSTRITLKASNLSIRCDVWKLAAWLVSCNPSGLLYLYLSATFGW